MEIKYVQDPKLNKRVSKVISMLVKDIIHNFHPKSIILTGSFGRGEGTVIKENGKLRFFSDCEIIIIPNFNIFRKEKLKQFSEKFYKKTGLKVVINGTVLTLYLMFPFLLKRMKPTIANYDLKYGSRVLYGYNYLEKIPNFDPKDIPVWEGIRLLLNRMAESLKYFSLENPTKEMAFWADKIILACQDSLLLTIGQYHYSYKVRNERLQDLFPKYFRELESDIPDFLKITRDATNRKLYGFPNVKDPVKYWFKVSEICDSVFRYITGVYGIKFKDYLEFRSKYIKTISKINIDNSSVSLTISKILLYLLSRGIIAVKPFIKMSKIDHLIYSIIPLVYFGACSNNTEYLKEAEKYIDLIASGIGLKKKEDTEEDYCIKVRNYLVTIWTLIFG